MVVLSVEGQGYVDRDTWATHKILGVYPTEADAVESLPSHDLCWDEDIVLVTPVGGTPWRTDAVGNLA
jgi:hypothetical protein